jgi:hypothetical protein
MKKSMLTVVFATTLMSEERASSIETVSRC